LRHAAGTVISTRAMLPYLQAIRHAAVTMPIKNPHQVEQRHHGKNHPSHQRKVRRSS
jgi:hypothetical protein